MNRIGCNSLESCSDLFHSTDTRICREMKLSKPICSREAIKSGTARQHISMSIRSGTIRFHQPGPAACASLMEASLNLDTDSCQETATCKFRTDNLPTKSIPTLFLTFFTSFFCLVVVRRETAASVFCCLRWIKISCHVGFVSVAYRKHDAVLSMRPCHAFSYK